MIDRHVVDTHALVWSLAGDGFEFGETRIQSCRVDQGPGHHGIEIS